MLNYSESPVLQSVDAQFGVGRSNITIGQLPGVINVIEGMADSEI